MSYDDFADPGRVRAVYLPEVLDLLRTTLGSQNVAILEYLVCLLFWLRQILVLKTQGSQTT